MLGEVDGIRTSQVSSHVLIEKDSYKLVGNLWSKLSIINNSELWLLAQRMIWVNFLVQFSIILSFTLKIFDLIFCLFVPSIDI
jgi:hypothetical protein